MEFEWIPLKTEPVTDEEREENGWDENITQKFVCPLPDDGDEILISRNNGKWVDLVVFCNDDYGVGDENGNDWLYEVDAWMPIPKGYVRETE